VVVELLESLDGVDEDDDVESKGEKYRYRFPVWTWLQHRKRCMRALWELLLMAEDEYEHVLGPFHSLVLHNCIVNWTERLKTDTPEAMADSSDLETIADLEAIARTAFPNTHFLEVDRLAADLLRGGGLAKRLHVDLRCYVDLLPDDIRAAVATRLGPEADALNGSPRRVER